MTTIEKNPTIGQGNRNIYCPHDSECVDLAAKADWPNFHCENCDYKNTALAIGEHSTDEARLQETDEARLQETDEARLQETDEARLQETDIIVRTKKCNWCKEEKPLTEFYRNKGYADGRKNECKACHRDYQQKKRDKTKEGPKKRVCTKCRKEKPLTEYHAYYKGKYGKKSICKLCTSYYNRRHWEGIKKKGTDRVYMEDLRAMIDEHWDYVAKVIRAHGDDGNIDVIEFHYKTAFEHGYKHAMGEVDKKT